MYFFVSISIAMVNNLQVTGLPWSLMSSVKIEQKSKAQKVTKERESS